MQKTITKKQLNDVLNSLMQIDYSEKNIFTLRAEKLSKKYSDLAGEINQSIREKREEYATTDEKGNFVYEQVTISSKDGSSRTENTGNFKYTFQKAKQRDIAIEKVLSESVTIPVNVIDKEKNKELYSNIIKKYSSLIISDLAGILLDVPLGEDGFVDEEFVLSHIQEEKTKE